MKNSITLRNAIPDDAESLSTLAVRSKAHWGYSAEFMELCAAELTYDARRIRDPRYHFTIAELSSTIVGFYALETMDADSFELEALFVEPTHIGTGIGRLLFRHAQAHVADNDAKLLRVQSDPHAKHFYTAMSGEHVGFRESGSMPGRTLPLFEFAIQHSLVGTPDVTKKRTAKAKT